jgi:hypothetical protein
MTFEEWLAELDMHARLHGYAAQEPYGEPERAIWRRYYDAGWDPFDAKQLRGDNQDEVLFPDLAKTK